MTAGTEIRGLVRRACCATRVPAALLRVRGNSFIFMFHGVGDGIISVNAFRRLLIELGRTFEFLSLDRLTRGPRAEIRRGVFLTFDDGLRNNYEFAYPVLQQMGIPATFYVCPGLIEAGSWLWTHEVRERLRILTVGERNDLAHEIGCTPSDPDSIVTHMKTLRLAARRSIEHSLRGATPEFQPDSAQRQRYDLMGWTDISQLDPQLITIGSHTMTHALLDSVTAEEAEYEVVTSRQTLEARLDREVLHFCYPNGNLGPVAEMLVRENYSSATITRRGFFRRAPADLYRLPRVAAHRDPDQMWLNLCRTRPSG